MATLLYTIDATIVNVALPHMQGSLQASQDQASWVLTSYIVISAIMTPLAGWLGTRFGLRPVMLASVAGFTLGSVLCGLATDLDQMILFRIVQGAAGAGMVPLSQIILLQEYPREQHARVTAYWGVGVMVGPVVGPTLGGWLTDELSWRWAFLINLPIGIVCLFGLLVSMRRGGGDTRRDFDLKGFVLLSIAIGLFQLMLDRGQQNDWFAATETVAEAFFAALAFYMFVAHAVTSRHPFVDLKLFGHRNFVLSLGVMLAVGVAIFGPTFLLPGFLQQLQGYSPSQAGAIVATRGVASIFAMLLSARLAKYVDPRAIMFFGIALTAVSLWFMGQFSVDTPREFVEIACALQGIGTPLTFTPLTLLAFGDLPMSQRAEASALLTLVRNIGSSIGISSAVAVMTRSRAANESYLAEHFTAYDPARLEAMGLRGGDPGGAAAAMLEIARQAAGIAYSNTFLILGACTCLALPAVLFLSTKDYARFHGRAAADQSAVDVGH